MHTALKKLLEYDIDSCLTNGYLLQYNVNLQFTIDDGIRKSEKYLQCECSYRIVPEFLEKD